MRAVLTLVLVIATSGAALEARAQDCAEGRERTGGFCCWPGQTFSTESRHCEGSPHCPEALVEHGEECVVPLFVSVPTAPTEATVTIPPYEAFGATETVRPATQTSSDWPAVHDGEVLHHPVRRTGEDAGLVAASLVVFDIGWVMGLIIGMIDAASLSCGNFSGVGPANVACNSGGFALIPVGGGIFAGMTNFATVRGTSRQQWVWGFALGIPSVILQGAGLISLAIALANEVGDIGLPALAVDGVSLSFVAAAQGADAGASLVLSF